MQLVHSNFKLACKQTISEMFFMDVREATASFAGRMPLIGTLAILFLSRDTPHRERQGQTQALIRYSEIALAVFGLGVSMTFCISAKEMKSGSLLARGLWM